MLPLVLIVAFASLPRPGFAQPQDPPPRGPAVTIDGPPPPIAPAVVSRDENGGVTIRATRLSEPLRLDGRLDEAVYETVPSVGDFIQQEPVEGAPATERSEVWVFYDENNVYIAARFWKSNPDDLVANEMRRDQNGIINNDSIGVILDTFYDRRSGYYLNTNALGGVRDALLIDENRNANMSFDLVWDVKSAVFDGGWTTEMAVPFKSLRYPSRREQVWGFLVQRIDMRKNEVSYLTPIPPSYGYAGIWKVSSAATLVGIEAPSYAGLVDVKPYALSSVVTDRQAVPVRSGDLSADFGFDAKYKLSKSVNVDFTYNTDFAQVEVDSQQVNLTRFSLFFPEKREFFLETQNLFNFGGGGGMGGPGTTPILFFSRRIGIDNGVQVPLTGGARLSGRMGKYNVGVLSIRTKESETAGAPATTFSVARVRRDILRASSVGIIATDRAPSGDGHAGNRVFGADVTLQLSADLTINSYYAKTWTEGAEQDDNGSYRAQFNYNADRYGLEVDHLKVGSDFDPAIGYLSREDFRRNYVQGRFSPRPANLRGIRKLFYEVEFENITNNAGVLETRELSGVFRMQFENSDETRVEWERSADYPHMAFNAAGARIEPGEYVANRLQLTHTLGNQRPVNGRLTASLGGFYGGTRTEAGYSGRVSLTSQFMVEPSLSFNWIDLPQGSFTTRLISARTIYTMTPRMFVAALVQYNSASSVFSTNVRYRWEYRPGSDLYIVYNDGRDTGMSGRPSELLSRSFAIKFTRLLQL